MLPDPACVSEPILSLDLAAEGIRTIIWRPATRRTMAAEGRRSRRRPGGRATSAASRRNRDLFPRLPWQTRRGSSFIWGVWHDARYVADHIAKQRAYFAYRPAELSAHA